MMGDEGAREERESGNDREPRADTGNAERSENGDEAILFPCLVSFVLG